MSQEQIDIAYQKLDEFIAQVEAIKNGTDDIAVKRILGILVGMKFWIRSYIVQADGRIN
jgi:hypothetical protein